MMKKGNELKPHIGIFGRRNNGKSSLVNYLTEQQIAIVSPTAGTTTDPVKKSMELIGVGPVIWVDTAGIDDEGSLGSMRVDKSLDVLPQCDLALVLFAHNSFGNYEEMLLQQCQSHNVPYLLIYTQTDLEAPNPSLITTIEERYQTKVFCLSVYDNTLREPLNQRIHEALPESSYRHKSLLGDVIEENDVVVMVAPIDSSAPEGRLILPQVQVLRDLLDHHAQAVVCQPSELQSTLNNLQHSPRLVITDSQAFAEVNSIVPPKVMLTSFSVVLARAKGLFEEYVKGTPTISQLQEGDRIALLESCTHNVTCEDIGRVKIPNLLQKKTGKNLVFDVVAGLGNLPHPINDYRMVIQCGGCVVTPKQLASRLAPAIAAGIPVSNYGLTLAYLNGIFQRSMEIFL